MTNIASVLGNHNKFLILGGGFSGSFFAKNIRKFGCTALTSSRSKVPSNSFVFNSERAKFRMKKYLMESHIFLVATSTKRDQY